MIFFKTEPWEVKHARMIDNVTESGMVFYMSLCKECKVKAKEKEIKIDDNFVRDYMKKNRKVFRQISLSRYPESIIEKMPCPNC